MPTWILIILLTLSSNEPLAQYCYADSNIYDIEAWYSVPVYSNGDYLYSYLDIDIEYVTIDNASVDYSCIVYYDDRVINATFYTLSDNWYGVDIDTIIYGKPRSFYVTRLYRNTEPQ